MVNIRHPWVSQSGQKLWESKIASKYVISYLCIFPPPSYSPPLPTGAPPPQYPIDLRYFCLHDILSVPLGILVLLQIPYSIGWAVGSLPSCISGGSFYQRLLQRFYSFAAVLYIFSCHPKFSFAFQVAMGKSAVPHLLG